VYYRFTGGCTGDYVGGRWVFVKEHWVFIKEGLLHEFGDSTNKILYKDDLCSVILATLMFFGRCSGCNN
jgi:hypothetical protein